MVSFCLTSEVVFASPALSAEAPSQRLLSAQIAPHQEAWQPGQDEIKPAGLTILSHAQDISYLRSLAAERPAPQTPQEVYETERYDAPPPVMELISVAFDESYQISRHLLASDVIPTVLPFSYDEATPWVMWREGEVFYGLFPRRNPHFAPDVTLRFDVTGLLTHQRGTQRQSDTAHGTLIFDSGTAALTLSLIDSAAQHHRLTASFSNDEHPFGPAILDSGGHLYDASLAPSFFMTQGRIATVVGFLIHQQNAPLLGGLVSGLTAEP